MQDNDTKGETSQQSIIPADPQSQSGECPIWWPEPKGNLGTPESTEFGSIVDHLAHSPGYRAALMEALTIIGNRDPFDFKERAAGIIDDSVTYNKATRDRVDDVYNGGNLDALIAVVTKAESGALVHTEHAPAGRSEAGTADAGDFDPVEAVDHLISIFCGGCTPNDEADLLYKLLTLASESKDPQDFANLSDAKRRLFPYTTIGEDGMRTLDASVINSESEAQR